MTSVTMVTRDATLDEFSVSDYRDMVIELLGTYSLRKLDDLTGNICSPALWAKVQHGEAAPNRKQRNALRKLYDRAPLPPTVADAVSVASPDAAVWTVGEGVPDTVVMVAGSEPVTLHVNGAVTAIAATPDAFALPSNSSVAPRKPRIRYSRPCATKSQQERRIAVGASWGEIIDAGLKAYEVIA